MRRTGSAVESGHIFLSLYNPGILSDIRRLFLKKHFSIESQKLLSEENRRLELKKTFDVDSSEFETWTSNRVFFCDLGTIFNLSLYNIRRHLNDFDYLKFSFGRLKKLKLIDLVYLC